MIELLGAGPVELVASVARAARDRVPSHHDDFLGGEFGYAGRPEAFVRRLREVLDES